MTLWRCLAVGQPSTFPLHALARRSWIVLNPELRLSANSSGGGSPSAKHIGIVAVSPEGSALCYRELFRYALHHVGDRGHPVVSMHGEPFENYLAALAKDDWHAIGELLLKSARALKAAGAEFCICPDNVAQNGIHLIESASPLPWLTMTEMVTNAVARDERQVVGLIGTKMVMHGSTYQALLGLKRIKVIVPDGPDADALNAIIFGELVHGDVVPESRQRIIEIIEKLKDKGAEGLIMAFSEGALMLDAYNSPLPIYDPVGLLAHGALGRSLGTTAR